MARRSTKRDGGRLSTIELGNQGAFSVSPAKHVKHNTKHGKDLVPRSKFNHLASRVVRNSQICRHNIDHMPYFGAPLDDEGSIRLLVLKPGALDSPVMCELSTENIQNLPPFEALSYAWGNPEQRTPITVAGQLFSVTTNLAMALQYLRYPDRARALWVDALCIDQQNALEVNVQIQHMTDIYGCSSAVLAWLGPYDESVRLAFDAIRTMSDIISPEDIGHLTTLFSRPYWTRLWVVQELVLARDVQFVCGREYLPWKAVDRLFRRQPLDRKTPFDTLPLALRNIVYRLRHIWHAREIRSDGQALSFSQLLNKYNPCRCSQPKDYVYSLLGLAAPAVCELIQPDYTTNTSVEDVFRQATVAAIMEDQNLNILCLVRRHSDYNMENIPRALPLGSSWVGDWSCVRVIRPLIEPDSTEQLYATYKEGSFSEENFVFKSFGILKIRGARFDKLDVVRNEVNPLADDWEENVKSWEPSDCQNYRYPTEEDPVDAFWRTMIIDDSFAPFHKVHERLTSQQKDEYRELYLKWRDDAGGSAGEDERSFAQCFRWSPVFNSLTGWTFAITHCGYFARVQPDTEPGDAVVLLRGGAVPFIMRPVRITGLGQDQDQMGEKMAWRLMGPAYVHGIMDGEAMASDSLLAEEDFLIM